MLIVHPRAYPLTGDDEALARLEVVLRATGHDQHYAPMLAQRGITELVELAPPTPWTRPVPVRWCGWTTRTTSPVA